MRRGIGRLRAGGSVNPIPGLFPAGEQGAWYDPSDFASEYQDSVGLTPVTALTNPVGLMLDKRLGIGRTDLIANGDFSGGTTAGWVAGNSASLSVVNGAMRVTNGATANGYATYSFPTVVGQRYFVNGLLTAVTSTAILRAGTTANGFDYFDLTPVTGPVTSSSSFVATATTAFVTCINAGSTSGFASDYDNLVAWTAPGNHLLQATGGSRPLEQSQGGFLATKSDGLDDYLAATTGGGGTAGFFYCAAINPSAIGANQTLWADTGTNTGYRVRLNSSNQLELSAGNNVAFTTANTTATVTTGTTYVVMAWHDGANLNVQINSNTVGTAAFGTTTAGTAAFTDAASNGGASGFFSGYLFNRVYKKDSGLTSAQRTQVQQYIANKAGVTL